MNKEMEKGMNENELCLDSEENMLLSPFKDTLLTKESPFS